MNQFMNERLYADRFF